MYINSVAKYPRILYIFRPSTCILRSGRLQSVQFTCRSLGVGRNMSDISMANKHYFIRHYNIFQSRLLAIRFKHQIKPSLI